MLNTFNYAERPQRGATITAAVVVGIALLALMVYSLDRTAWAFQVYEGASATGAPLGAKVSTGWSQHMWLGFAAAVVVEFAALALIAGEAVMQRFNRDALRWAHWSLVIIFAVQWVVNLTAGGIRGWTAMAEQLGDATFVVGGYDLALILRSVVAVSMFLIINSAIPALLLCLAKIEAALIRSIIETSATDTQPAIAERNSNAKAQVVSASASSERNTSANADTQTLVALLAEPPASSAIEPQTATDERNSSAEAQAKVAVPAQRHADYQAILNILPDSPTLPSDLMAKAIGKGTRTAETRRKELVDMGVLYKDGTAYRKNGVDVVAADE
jgi:hypothetical protein